MTMDVRRIAIVIAAYNEAKVIAGVVREVASRGYEVIVVDDGSQDGTPDIAREAGARVIVHPVNLGQGAALQTGIELALAQGADFVVTYDADGQHHAADIENLVGALKTHQADFALGNRFMGEAENITGGRRLLLQVATTFTRLTTGMKVTDTHNGLRAMTRQGAGHIHLRQNRMAHASEILHQIAASGLPFVEVPVTITYSMIRKSGNRFSDKIMLKRQESGPHVAQPQRIRL